MQCENVVIRLSQLLDCRIAWQDFATRIFVRSSVLGDPHLIASLAMVCFCLFSGASQGGDFDIRLA